MHRRPCAQEMSCISTLVFFFWTLFLYLFTSFFPPPGHKVSFFASFLPFPMKVAIHTLIRGKESIHIEVGGGFKSRTITSLAI